MSEPTLKQGAKQHPDLFLGCDETRVKYEHLLKVELAEWKENRGIVRKNGLRDFVVEKMLADKAPLDFEGSVIAEAMYSYLNSPALSEWGKIFTEPHGDTVDTHYIRDQLLQNHDVLLRCADARAKYEHLIPTDLKKWEYKWVGGGTKAWIPRSIYNKHKSDKTNDGLDVFAECGSVRAKYGHLVMPTLGQWEDAYLDEADGGTAWIKTHLLENLDVFWGCEHAKKKYVHLHTTELGRWEYRNLASDGSTSKIEELRRGNDILACCPEPAAKYAHLIPTKLQRWTQKHLWDGSDGLRFKENSKGLDPNTLFRDCPEARLKYQHLLPSTLERWEHNHINYMNTNYLLIHERYRGCTMDMFFEGCPEAKHKYGYVFKARARISTLHHEFVAEDAAKAEEDESTFGLP